MHDINCIIVDDEPLARLGMEKMIAEISSLTLKASCNSTVQAQEALKKFKIDLIFLDIEMPEVSGMQFLKKLEQPPAAIITTAFLQYAIESYELNVIDYLVKPIAFERLLKAVKKAIEYIKSTEVNNEFFFIKCEHRYEKVFYDDILFIQGLQNYVIIQTTQKRHITYLTLKVVAEYLPASKFIKVNKSYIVSIQKVDVITSNQLRILDHSFTIGQGYKNEIFNVFLKNKLLVRNRQ